MIKWWVYVLHFARPYWRGNCQHYIGYTIDLDARLAKHRSGKGSLLVAYALRHSNVFELVYSERQATQSTARRREQQIKSMGAQRFCPHCKGRC